MFSIAIDGPAGSGKSTIAKILAKIYNLIYIDTGAMYRAVALYCINENINVHNNNIVISQLKNIDISFSHLDNTQKIFLQNKDVTSDIRNQSVAEAACVVATICEVREALVDIQRNLSLCSDIVMDGRDIGTIVLPFASVKFYLDACITTRTKRRCEELEDKGLPFDYETVKNEIIKRDFNDVNRLYSPLRKAPDAIEIDTSFLSTDQVVASMRPIIESIRNK